MDDRLDIPTSTVNETHTTVPPTTDKALDIEKPTLQYNFDMMIATMHEMQDRIQRISDSFKDIRNFMRDVEHNIKLLYTPSKQHVVQTQVNDASPFRAKL